MIEKAKAELVKKHKIRSTTNITKKVVQKYIPLVLQGKTQSEIVTVIQEQENFQENLAEKTYAKILEAFGDYDPGKWHELRNLAYQRLEDLYQKAYKEKKWNVCASIEGQMIKLMGLDAPVQSEVSVSLKPIRKMTDAEILTLLEKDKEIKQLN